MIHKYLYGVVATRVRWMLYFARTGIEPLRVYYEDVSANPQREIDRIAAFIGSCGPAIVKPELVEVRVQRDALMDEWRARFIEAHGNPDAIDGP